MSTKSNQKRRYSSDNDITKRKVNYDDYLLLKDSYVEIGEKNRKLEENYKKLYKSLKEYQTQISEFQKTKKNISEMFKKIQEKLNKDKNNKGINETKKILELEKEINIKNGEIIRIKEMNLDLENKIKFLEEDINKIKEECSNKDKIIEEMKIKEKKLEEDLKQREDENLLIFNKLNELKEECEKEELFKSKNSDINNNNLFINKKFFNSLSIEENMNISIIPSKNNKNENLLAEEKNILITNSRKSETNSSTNKNKNEIMKNVNTNNFLNNINENILSNYLNTINVGYNGLSDSHLEIEKDNNLLIDDSTLECEPIPSFITCIKKAKNE